MRSFNSCSFSMSTFAVSIALYLSRFLSLAARSPHWDFARRLRRWFSPNADLEKTIGDLSFDISCGCSFRQWNDPVIRTERMLGDQKSPTFVGEEPLALSADVNQPIATLDVKLLLRYPRHLHRHDERLFRFPDRERRHARRKLRRLRRRVAEQLRESLDLLLNVLPWISLRR